MRSMLRGGMGVLVAGAVAAGCAPTRITTDYDRRASFVSFATFDVQEGQVFREGTPDPGDTLVRDRIDAALKAELAEKGLREDDADPDLVVRYATSVYTRPEIHHDPAMWEFTYGGVYPWAPMWGTPFWSDFGYSPIGGWTTVHDVREGRMTIEIVDTDRNKIVYQAEAEAEDKDFRSPKYIRKTVEKALARYPGS